MTRPADPAPTLARFGVRFLAVAGLGGLLAITLASPGATRMFAWPWSIAYVAALVAPGVVLVLRAQDPSRPLVLPPRPWSLAVAFAALVVLAAALQSPHRGPSLWWSAPLLSAVAAFLALFDWLHGEPAASARRRRLLGHALTCFFAVVALTSIGLWAAHLVALPVAHWAAARNPFPLGHSNYTAGLALLMLPWLVGQAVKERGRWRAASIAVGVGALIMLGSSGSRAAVMGLVASIAAAILLGPGSRKRKSFLLLGGAAAALVLGLAHPRTRAMFAPADPSAAPNPSNVQRTAMLQAGFRMGQDRPLLGWGPGSTPLVYPNYRATLAGGAENVLQLHSLPAQLWAELGVLGVASALVGATLLLRRARHEMVVGAALMGYLVFACFDWQLDVPAFGFVLAAYGALLAPTPLRSTPRAGARSTAVVTLVVFAIVVLAGRRDPTPELNVRALQLAADPAQAPRAIALLRESLAQNSAQEIAHFNLGWLLVVRDPAAAERHFRAAARLVPDKGGVYFGMGLARLNQGKTALAAQALALESLNDPVFLTSPWWNAPEIADLRPAALSQSLAFHERVDRWLPRETWAARENRYAHALAAWMAERGDVSAVLAHAPTPARRDYFEKHRELPSFAAGSAVVYRRERTGYPVLMRNLDLPVPIDLFEVRDSAMRSGPLGFLFPAKGWLPSPLLIALLEDSVSAPP